MQNKSKNQEAIHHNWMAFYFFLSKTRLNETERVFCRYIVY
ncbi:hypothetical protein PNI0009_01625 [Streptococcus pneumoniae PNI0009]|nr:hypothetical protein PNI0006_00529 [Streptococcus pneumoniae PNI0006]ELU78297.1 hypothetical protein PNI0009_01625 [Streptococcus pneumoniae PNI0009]